MRQDGGKGLQQAVPCEDATQRRAVVEDRTLHPRELRREGHGHVQGRIGGLCGQAVRADLLRAGQPWRVLRGLLQLRDAHKHVSLELLPQVWCGYNQPWGLKTTLTPGCRPCYNSVNKKGSKRRTAWKTKSIKT